MSTYKTVLCPTCGKSLEWRPENCFKPFCSERCKLIDLGEWATENYRVPEQDQAEFPTPDQTDR